MKIPLLRTSFSFLLLLSGHIAFSQQKFGDNLGNHTATSDLYMKSYNIRNVKVLSAENVVIGTATPLTNGSIALQVNGANQAILVSRVSDLLNATSPSIPAADAVPGMIVYDLKTNKFYLRNNVSWITYGTTSLADGNIFIGSASGEALPVPVSGDITISNTGVTTIGAGKVVSNTIASGAVVTDKIADANVTAAKLAASASYNNKVLTTDGSGVNTWVDRSKFASTDLNSGQILLGNASNVATAIAPTGDVTIDNAGVTTIGADKVTTAKILNANVTTAKIADANITTDKIADGNVTTTKMAPGANGNQVLRTNASNVVTWGNISDLGFVDLTTKQSVGGVKIFTDNGGLLATGTMGTGDIPAFGAGMRMMWYPAKAAFRAGAVGGIQWDALNVGDYSAAFGSNSLASGSASFVAGSGNTASADNTTVFGLSNTASGTESFAGGTQVKNSGTQSFGFGNTVTVNGSQSLAIGYMVKADANNAVALGSYASTNGKAGSFAFGDGSSANAMTNDVANQMAMRFAGGYKFYTNADATTYIEFAAGANGMSVTSDRRKKENFQPADGESFLQKIEKMPLSSWNYKTQDAKQFRHYGPMAQDFYAAFGKDAYGKIGNDTTISSTDFDGVNMIAIQGLVKRTNALKVENAKLVAENAKLSALVGRQEEKLEIQLALLQRQLNEQKELLAAKLGMQEKGRKVATKRFQKTVEMTLNKVQTSQKLVASK